MADNAVVLHNGHDSQPLVITSQTNHHLMPVVDVAAMVSRRGQIMSLIKEILIEGTDFGSIPGTEKKTLLKPGAEKLCSFFGLEPTLIQVDKVLDWSGSQHDGEPFFFFEYRCELYRDGRRMGAGDGSCNSRETKYRYRWVNEGQVPTCFDKSTLERRDSSITEFEFAVKKAETSGKYGKPADYWAKFAHAMANNYAVMGTKKASTGKEMVCITIPAVSYRIPNPEIADQVNTIEKMAQKRAHIAATLMAIGLSEFFTQDLEDFDNLTGSDVPLTMTPTQQSEPSKQPEPPKPETIDTTNGYGPIPVKQQTAPEPAPTTTHVVNDPGVKLKAVTERVAERLVANLGMSKAAAAAAISDYWRGGLGVPLPKDLAMYLPLAEYLEKATTSKKSLEALQKDPKGCGAKAAEKIGKAAKKAEEPAPKRERQFPISYLTEELAKRRGITVDEAIEHLVKTGLTSDDEKEAYLIMAWYTQSARLTVRHQPSKVLPKVEARFKLYPFNAEIASEVETYIVSTFA